MSNKSKEGYYYAASLVFLALLVLAAMVYFGYAVSQKIESAISQKVAMFQYASLSSPRISTELAATRATNSQSFGLKFTPQSYSGDFAKSGKTGDEICSLAYPGYRFCTTEVLNAAGGSIPDAIGYVNPFMGGWVAFPNNESNCADWHSSSQDKKGGRLYANGSTVSRWWILSNADKSCDTPLPLCCYK